MRVRDDGRHLEGPDGGAGADVGDEDGVVDRGCSELRDGGGVDCIAERLIPDVVLEVEPGMC